MLLHAFRRVNKTFLLLLQKCSHAHTYTQTERKIKTVESSVRDFYRFRNRFYGNNVRFYKVFTLNIGTITKPKLNQTNGCSHTHRHTDSKIFSIFITVNRQNVQSVSFLLFSLQRCCWLCCCRCHVLLVLNDEILKRFTSNFQRTNAKRIESTRNNEKKEFSYFRSKHMLTLLFFPRTIINQT